MRILILSNCNRGTEGESDFNLFFVDGSDKAKKPGVSVTLRRECRACAKLHPRPRRYLMTGSMTFGAIASRHEQVRPRIGRPMSNLRRTAGIWRFHRLPIPLSNRGYAMPLDDLIRSASGGSAETLAYARDYRRRGWRVIPIPAGSKAPKLRGWQTLDLGLDDLPRHFAAGGNIGIAFGPRCGDLVDIDLDCPEALALQDLYLPKTEAEFGRPSKPRSHRFYICPGAAYEAFADPLIAELAKERGGKAPKDTLLELRADPGHQTIVPPSIADGELRAWHGDRIARRVIPAADLRRAAVWLAIGCLVMRHVSEHAARRPRPIEGELFGDLPTLLFEAEPVLGRKAFHWLGLPAPDDKPPDPQRPRRSSRWLVTADHGDVDLGELVAAIPNDCNRADWVSMGLAIYAATDGSGDGRGIFLDFSRKSAKHHNASTVAEVWKQFEKYPPSRTGIGKLFKLAIDNGWRSRR